MCTYFWTQHIHMYVSTGMLLQWLPRESSFFCFLLRLLNRWVLIVFSPTYSKKKLSRRWTHPCFSSIWRKIGNMGGEGGWGRLSPRILFLGIGGGRVSCEHQVVDMFAGRLLSVNICFRAHINMCTNVNVFMSMIFL